MRMMALGPVFAAILLVSFVGCSNQLSEPPAEGEVKIDNTDPSGTCAIIVLNTSEDARALRIAYATGKVLLDAQVPSRANSRPPQWRSFRANVTGQDVSITIAGSTKTAPVRKDTVQIVINVGQGVNEESALVQHSRAVQWR